MGNRFLAHDSERISRPLVRASWLEEGVFTRPELRGGEPLIETDWETALDLAGKALADTVASSGNEAVFAGSYGWASAGRFHHAPSQLKRFMNTLGGFVNAIGTYSHGAAEAVAPDVLGLEISEFLRIAPPVDEVVQWTETLVSFGGFPAANSQITSGGSATHWYRSQLLSAAEQGCKFLAVSPVRTDFDSELDAEWIPIRPGTDAAFMLGLAGELVATQRWDQDAVARYCSDPTLFLDYMAGKFDGVIKNAAWAAQICGTQPEKLCAIAERLSQSRSLINATWSTQRVANGEQVLWALCALGALVGQLAQPGAGFSFGYGSMGSVGEPSQSRRLASLPQGVNPVSTAIPVSRIADALLSPGDSYWFRGAQHTYPRIELIYWCGGNPFHHHQDLRRLDRAWRMPKAVIVNDPCLTATAQRADIVFPTTTALERADLGGASTGRHLVAMQPVVDRFGEARHDHEIFTSLAERLGTLEAFTESRSEVEWQRFMYENSARIDSSLPDWDRFVEQGITTREADPAPNQWKAFLADPEASPLPTESGRIQLSIGNPAVMIGDQAFGCPQWIAPPEWLGAAESDQLHLLSPMPAHRLHSQFAGGDTGPAQASMNSADAVRQGCRDGDLVSIGNDRGAFAAIVKTDDRVSVGVVVVENGAWLDLVHTQDGEICKRGNPNAATSDRATSRWGQACASHTCLVSIRPAHRAD